MIVESEVYLFVFTFTITHFINISNYLNTFNSYTAHIWHCKNHIKMYLHILYDHKLNIYLNNIILFILFHLYQKTLPRNNEYFLCICINI